MRPTNFIAITTMGVDAVKGMFSVFDRIAGGRVFSRCAHVKSRNCSCWTRRRAVTFPFAVSLILLFIDLFFPKYRVRCPGEDKWALSVRVAGLSDRRASRSPGRRKLRQSVRHFATIFGRAGHCLIWERRVCCVFYSSAAPSRFRFLFSVCSSVRFGLPSHATGMQFFLR